MGFNEEDYYYSISEVFTCINSPNSYSKKGKMSYNKKRFSDEQVKSLETIFENETKLEPKKKVQIAKELGLQPRQIAIWFQNKRARYKSKELERDYNVLRDSYNVLVSKFDVLKKEKLSLSMELEKMKDQVEKSGANQCGNESGKTNSEESIIEINTRKRNDKNESDRSEGNQHTLSVEASEHGASILSADEGSSENNNYFGMDDEPDLLAMVQPIVANSLPSPQEWGDLPQDGLFDPPADNCQWLDDFWS